MPTVEPRNYCVSMESHTLILRTCFQKKFMTHRLIASLVAATFALISCNDLSAQFFVNSTGLGPGATVESFEGISASGNMSLSTSLNLPSGIIFAGPTPPRFDSFAPLIVNGGFFGLGTADPVIPSGTAYFGQANPGLFDAGISFQLPANTFEVGAFLGVATSSSPNAAVEVSVFDVGGNLLGSTIRTGDSGVTTAWAQNFVGFQSSVPIGSILYDGSGAGVLRIDDLQVAVPEPSSSLFALAAFSLASLKRRRSFS